MNPLDATPSPVPTLHELCDPLFQEICRLNRIGRKAPAGEYAITYSEIKGIFANMAERARKDVRLNLNYEKVELALVFFVDFMIAEAKLPYSAEWNKKRLAYERNELAGDEKFFDMLDETLADTKEGAVERLVIYYICLGLGFSGWYMGQDEYLRKKQKEILPRIRPYLDTDESGLISPDAYKSTNTVNLPLPMGSTLIPMLICLVTLIVVVIAANIVLFKTASSELTQSVDEIRAHENASAAQGAANSNTQNPNSK
ncbi:type VI protein secretion system component VasF [Ereboglobus sp. PH5-10]|uniref:DotU family type IV/VI secretion system protein n=1 Tax=Ereboglobus sp. PH5-10 TaxID=2940629 RepID=UPI0024049637|nr:DotU family type IV/VI secretion system protein [Ereboglobus sp. PH5-10]MDF9826538.1 type VI protein secretion system component VasF [Ereboglobus sp. PH5-10]